MTTTIRSAPRTSVRVRTLMALGIAVILGALMGTWFWTKAQSATPSAAQMLPADRATNVMRRVDVAFDDAQAVWDRAVRATTGSTYHRAADLFVSRPVSTICSPQPISAPFYCPNDATAAFDVVYLDFLGLRLRDRRDLGLALYSARVAAMHLQRELGVLDAPETRRLSADQRDRALALQADCLTGVWAAAAEPRIGTVPAGFWSELIWSSRNVSDDFRAAGNPLEKARDPLAKWSREERTVAFDEGYASGQIGGCPFTPEG